MLAVAAAAELVQFVLATAAAAAAAATTAAAGSGGRKESGTGPRGYFKGFKSKSRNRMELSIWLKINCSKTHCKNDEFPYILMELVHLKYHTIVK